MLILEENEMGLDGYYEVSKGQWPKAEHILCLEDLTIGILSLYASTNWSRNFNKIFHELRRTKNEKIRSTLFRVFLNN